ncbi:MAG: hypothetical protein ACPGN6_03020 [Gammaproteobacteria bacterium]
MHEKQTLSKQPPYKASSPTSVNMLNGSEKFLVWVIHHWAYELNYNKDPLPKIKEAFDSIGFKDSSQLTADIFSEIFLNLFTSSTVQLTVGCPHKLGTAEHLILGYLGFFQRNQLRVGENLLSQCLPSASLRLISKMLKALGKQLACHQFKISIRPEHLDMLSNIKCAVQKDDYQKRIIH